MQPDRFGQSAAGDFIESSGREREHAFDLGLQTPSIAVELVISGFSIPNVPGFDLFNSLGLYRQCHMVDDLSNVHRFYREADLSLNFPIVRLNQFGVFGAQPTNPAYIARVKHAWLNITAGVNPYFEWMDLGGNFGVNTIGPDNVRFFGSGGFTSRTLSDQINVKSWIRFAHAYLSAVGDFPAGGIRRLIFEPMAGTPVGDEPPHDPFGLKRAQWIDDLGRTQFGYQGGGFQLRDPVTGIGPEIGYAAFGLGVNHAILAGGGGSQFGIWPFGDDPVNDALKARVPWCTLSVSLIKTLMPLGTKPPTVKYWVVERHNSAFYELSCQSGAPSEVIMPPMEPLDRFDAPVQVSEPSGFHARRYQYPGSPPPEFTHLTPSCA